MVPPFTLTIHCLPWAGQSSSSSEPGNTPRLAILAQIALSPHILHTLTRPLQQDLERGCAPLFCRPLLRRQNFLMSRSCWQDMSGCFFVIVHFVEVKSWGLGTPNNGYCQWIWQEKCIKKILQESIRRNVALAWNFICDGYGCLLVWFRRSGIIRLVISFLFSVFRFYVL